ncbi:MAG: hypothetical protein ISR65_17660 [Bacteriovoracaceae bacterium]|nr:hypothetical protein [Bacteriovoracaceae bacterium]
MLSKKKVDISKYEMDFVIDGVMLDDPEEPRSFVTNIDGRIFLPELEDEQTDDEDPIGSVYCYVIQVQEIVNYGVELIDVFESIDDELFEYYTCLFSQNRYKDSLSEIAEPGLGLDLLIVDYLEINPKWRGTGLGLIAGLRTLQNFRRGCRYVAITPFPPQCAGWASGQMESKRQKMQQLDQGQDKATKALTRYWQHLGFKEVDDSGIFILSPLTPLPSASSVMAETFFKT